MPTNESLSSYLEEILTNQEELGEQIRRLVQQFEEATDLHVRALEVDHFWMGNTQRVVISPRVEVP